MIDIEAIFTHDNQIPAGQADHTRPHILSPQFLPCRKRQLYLGTGGDQGDIGEDQGWAGLFVRLSLPNLLLCLKPVLSRVPLLMAMLLIELIRPCGDLRSEIDRRLGQ